MAKGEFVSLLGVSGSGKTTLLRCLAGLETPDDSSGEVRVGARVFSGGGAWVPPEARGLGMVFQNYAVWPHMTVAENVAFPLRIRRLADAEVRKEVARVLELVRLGALSSRYPHELSGGQQQRVALARALAMSPEVLLLDEPLSNLDALLREELGAEIRRVQQLLKLTTILVTHDQKEALSLSDRIVLLDQGRIEAMGSPEELYARPPTAFAAQFLSGGEKIGVVGSEARLFIPRRWRRQTEPGEFGAFTVLSRLFLGNEYEYWAKSDKLEAPIRFFEGARIEMGDRVDLGYRD